MLHLSAALTAYILSLTALLGLIMGSFLNCFAWRLVHGESPAKGRSHCVSCGHVLSAKDLFPLASYVVLKGRCRYCGTHISLRYPMTELFALVMFCGLILRYDVTMLSLRLVVFCSILLLIALVDLETKEIPERLQLALILWYLLTLPFVSDNLLSSLLDGIKGGLLVSLPLLLVVLIMDKVLGRESMGGGDIKLFFSVGLYLGLALNLLNLLLSCVVGILLGTTFLLFQKERDEPLTIPFGPAIALGTWLTLLFGIQLVAWYLHFFY